MKAILWDMDGTLLDSEPLWGRATHALARELGGPLPEEVRARTIGGSAPRTVGIIAEHLGLDLDAAARARAGERLFELFLEAARGGAELRPGVAGLLAEARAAGIPQVLVTNTVRRVAGVGIAAIGPGWFAGTVCGDEVPAGKPAPDPYLAGARIAGAAPGECLAVEDSPGGATAAVAAGCRTLYVPGPGVGPAPAGAGELAALTGRRDLAGVDLAALGELHRRLGGVEQ
ncbi:hypothetical protein CSPHI_06660 [Corynebacterium sphenisci DSM 44792]|uniref:HAD family hydrolase n=1 Tax=Corynebacterium sphenisci DSM 44792 TaxID=1437874 RepID=A0A1L7CY67_9CORY|nr:HAD family phosphatase [Corynebacterium sphenisci]APT90778.1 hypothetical protein CSPHI_06660 [Corynebacterium sphenisci DSM 44792]